MHPAVESITKPARKPEPKPARSEPALNAASAVVSPFDAIVDQVDEVLAAAARGEQLTDADVRILERSGLIRNLDQERQIDRMRNILRQQALAGTKADREALRADIAAAERAEAEQAPELERQIAELTRQRELLAKAPEAAKQRLKTMLDAVENLRLLRRMPERVVEEYRNSCRITRGMQGVVTRLESEAEWYDEILRAADAGLAEVFDQRRGILRNVTPELVENATKQRQNTLEDIEAQKRLWKAAMEETDRLLDRYVR